MFVMLHLAGDLFLEVQLPSASWWFILDFSCVNSLPLCLRSFVETGFKHAMLGGWGLTDEKSYDAVSTKPSCKTFDKRLHSICIWFRNEPFFYGIYKFSFYRRLCPWHATLALGFSSQQVNTLCQDLDRSPVLSESSEILVAILWQWVEAAEKANRVFGFFLRFGGFLLLVRVSLFFLIYRWVHQIKLRAPRQVWLCWRPGERRMGRHRGCGCHPCAGARSCPRCRDNSCGAASTGVRFPFSSSHDLLRFLPRVCLLNSLPRRTCLSFPPFLLPCCPRSPLLPLPFSRSSAAVASPRDTAHRASRRVRLDCAFAGRYGKWVCSFSCPWAGGLRRVSASWKRCAGVKSCGVHALRPARVVPGGKPFCWCRWAEGLVPAWWLSWANPKPSHKPSNLLGTNHWFARETQPVLWRNAALVCLQPATPQRSVLELECLISLTLTSFPLTQSL